MSTEQQIKNYIINAARRPVGRVASEAALLLRGKREVSFQPNLMPAVRVTIENASQIVLTGGKWRGKIYTRYSGWPGGLSRENASDLARRLGQAELLRRAINRMLPRNKLRRQMLANLEIKL